jgi:hypothetical protein
MSVQDLQQTVEHLSKEELDQFSKWFEEYMADQWDAQIERDAKAGRFDAMAAKVRADHRAGLTTPL